MYPFRSSYKVSMGVGGVCVCGESVSQASHGVSVYHYDHVVVFREVSNYFPARRTVPLLARTTSGGSSGQNLGNFTANAAIASFSPMLVGCRYVDIIVTLYNHVV